MGIVMGADTATIPSLRQAPDVTCKPPTQNLIICFAKIKKQQYDLFKKE